MREMQALCLEGGLGPLPLLLFEPGREAGSRLSGKALLKGSALGPRGTVSLQLRGVPVVFQRNGVGLT